MTMKEQDLAKIVRPYSQSPWPAWTLASLFLGTIAFSPRSHPSLPPLPQRLGFSAIMFGAGYALSTGDVTNGSGISTAWTLAYLFWNGRRSLTTHRSPLTLALSGATSLCAALYGTEYFVLQDQEKNKEQ